MKPDESPSTGPIEPLSSTWLPRIIRLLIWPLPVRSIRIPESALPVMMLLASSGSTRASLPADPIRKLSIVPNSPVPAGPPAELLPLTVSSTPLAALSVMTDSVMKPDSEAESRTTAAKPSPLNRSLARGPLASVALDSVCLLTVMKFSLSPSSTRAMCPSPLLVKTFRSTASLVPSCRLMPPPLTTPPIPGPVLFSGTVTVWLATVLLFVLLTGMSTVVTPPLAPRNWFCSSVPVTTTSSVSNWMP